LFPVIDIPGNTQNRTQNRGAFRMTDEQLLGEIEDVVRAMPDRDTIRLA